MSEGYPEANFTANLSFTRELQEPDNSNRYVDWLNEEWARIAGSRFKANVLGHFDYTPAEELRDRLNDSLQGKEPTLAVNTRYWRNQ